MNCEEARNLIPLGVGGDGPDERPDLDSHIASCPSCKALWESHGRLLGFLAEAGKGPAPQDDEAFLKGVKERAQGLRVARPADRNILPWVLKLGAAAAVVGLLFAGMLLTGKPDSPEKGAARGDGAASAEKTDVEETPTVVLPPVEGTPFFGLEDTAPQDSGEGFLVEIDVVPDPATAKKGEEDRFPLSEMEPVSDIEVCADF